MFGYIKKCPAEYIRENITRSIFVCVREDPNKLLILLVLVLILIGFAIAILIGGRN